jgi:hypothetical protein
MGGDVAGRLARTSAPLTLPVAAMVMALIAVALGACLGPQTTRSTPGPSPTPGSSPTAPASSGSASPGATPAPTVAASDAPAILVGAGDIASCGSAGDEATADLLESIAGTIFTAGDNVYDAGTGWEFENCYGPTWGRFRDRTLPVAGNHDYETTGAAGYFAYFGAVAGDPAKGWYAVDLGAWRIYALNSNCWAIGGCEAGSPQESWLRDDLAREARPCVLAIWHHPLFSSGQHGSDPMTRALWQALEDAGAEIVISGHDHDYERFGAQTSSGATDPAGIIEYVVGTGGRSHYRFEAVADNSLVRNNDVFGVIRFELGADRWSFQFVPVSGGRFIDSSSGTCH